MAKKQTAKPVEVIEDFVEEVIADFVEEDGGLRDVPCVYTVKMARYDRAEPIEVPEDQVERYKQSSWKVV